MRVLGRVRVETGDAEIPIGRRQARELLALLVAHRGAALPTAKVIDALWDRDVPSSAVTIVHGHIGRLRGALGVDAVIHDGDGYRLALPARRVDLWSVDDAVRRGDHRVARTLWDEPVFGMFGDRPWARDALARLEHLGGMADERAFTAGTSRRSPVGRLVGRRQELAAVRAAITRGRLATIVGLGGVGKTRLALEVAASEPLAMHADLAGSVGPVATRVAGDLGLVATGEPDWDRRTVASVIGRREVLLILDGCEQDLTGAASVASELLAACPALRILATSRASLGAVDEQVVPLLPFDVPGDPAGETVTMLVDRMAMLGAHTTRRDRRRLAGLAATTSGVPLAVELIAADAVFDTSGPSVAPDPAMTDPDRGGSPPGRPRPARAVESAVDQVLGRLTPDAARAVRRLTRLPHGFTPALLTGVTAPGVSAPGILYELRASGLVSGSTVGGPVRLRLPDPVRAVAQRTHDPDALDDVRRGMTGTMDAVRPDLGAPIDTTAFAAAVDELANVDAVLDQLTAADDPVGALELATSAAETWAEAGHWSRGGARLDDLLARVHPEASPRRPGDVPGARNDGVPVAPLLWASAVRARIATVATYAAMHADRDRLGVAADIARDHDAGPLEAHLVFRLAVGAGYGGDLATARDGLERLRTIAEAHDNDYARALADQVGALDRLVSGRPDEAAVALEGVADRLDALAAPSDAARTLRVAGLAWRTAGRPDAALADLEAAEARARHSGARGTLATIRAEIVELRRERGDLDPQKLRDARTSVLAVGNLRAAGLLGRLIGNAERDPVMLAGATLELLQSDRIWASVALADLTGLLAVNHPLVREAPRLVAGLRRQWGSPLGVDEAARVDAFGPVSPGDGPDWSEMVEGDLRGWLRGIGGGGHAPGRDPDAQPV